MTDRILLKINNEKVPMNNYIKQLFKKLNLALISSLKGVDEKNLKEIEISITLAD
ncbi:MAG: hypothetical protein H7647_04860 [Candidatus Heimdallarchaeota archaeon]|jgi:hypothetical protein|nr:hypothetical protein [Candidatus Heimdallarchaeota archaeon]MCK4253754.1 hypothetical protein [Candidatus Heimdallarchaeota archaeon]